MMAWTIGCGWLACQALACQRDAEPPRARVSPQRIELRKATLDRFVEGRRVTTAIAEHAAIDRAKGVFTAEVTRTTIFDIDGSTRAEIFADRVEAETRTSSIAFVGNVKVTDRQERTLAAQKIAYDAANDRASSNDPVELRGKNYRVRGTGLKASLRDESFELQGPIEAHVERTEP